MKNIKVPSFAHGHDGHGVNREKKEYGEKRTKQERIKGTEKASPIHTLFHR